MKLVDVGCMRDHGVLKESPKPDDLEGSNRLDCYYPLGAVGVLASRDNLLRYLFFRLALGTDPEAPGCL